LRQYALAAAHLWLLKATEHHFGQHSPLAREDNGADTATTIHVDVPVDLSPSGLTQPFQRSSTLRLHYVSFGEMLLI
jgi:hypothetical protein